MNLSIENCSWGSSVTSNVTVTFGNVIVTFNVSKSPKKVSKSLINSQKIHRISRSSTESLFSLVHTKCRIIKNTCLCSTLHLAKNGLYFSMDFVAPPRNFASSRDGKLRPAAKDLESSLHHELNQVRV